VPDAVMPYAQAYLARKFFKKGYCFLAQIVMQIDPVKSCWHKISGEKNPLALVYYFDHCVFRRDWLRTYVVEAIATVASSNKLLHNIWDSFSVITQYLDFSLTFIFFYFMFQLQHPPCTKIMNNIENTSQRVYLTILALFDLASCRQKQFLCVSQI
jgi:hypothetical protein